MNPALIANYNSAVTPSQIDQAASLLSMARENLPGEGILSEATIPGIRMENAAEVRNHASNSLAVAFSKTLI